MIEPAPRELRTLADKVNYLFEQVRAPGQTGQYSNAEVARATGLSPTHIGYLRSGQRDNPSADSLRALARFFGVNASFLIDEDEQSGEHIAAQLRLRSLLENAKVQQIAMRLVAANPSAAALDAITEMVEQVLRLEASQQHKPSRRGRPEDS